MVRWVRRPVRRWRHGGEHKVIRVSPLPVVPDLPQPGRTLVVGVNVADSFSDGGAWFDPAAAITHGLDLASRRRRHHRYRRRVDSARCDSARGLRGAAPGTTRDPGIGGRRRLCQHRHHARRSRRTGDRCRCTSGK